MAIRVVNGTSIQAAIDSAAANDTLDVRAGGYAGFIVPAGKPLKVYGSGAARVESSPANGQGNVVQLKAAKSELKGFEVSGGVGQHGAGVAVVEAADCLVEGVLSHHHERGYCFRAYGAGAVRSVWKDISGHHAALGLHADRTGAGESTITNPKFWDIDRMLVNDPASGTDTGGMALGFKQNAGLWRVVNPDFLRAYSVKQTSGPDAGDPASFDYGWDGAHIELYESGPVYVEGGKLRGSPWIAETGKSAAGQNCRDFRMTGVEIFGEWPGIIPADPAQAGLVRSNNGFLFRSMDGALVENCKFHQIDWHLFLLERTGNYATGAVVQNIVSRNNEVWLKTGDNRYLSIGNVPLTGFKSINDKVYTVQGGTVVAITGRKTSDLATAKGWAPGMFEEAYWGPEIVDPVETELQKAIRERDEARTQRDQAVANDAADAARIVTLTAERNAVQSQLAAAQSMLLDAQVETGRVKGVVARAAVEVGV